MRLAATAASRCCAQWEVFLGGDGSAQQHGVFADCAAGKLAIGQLLIELHLSHKHKERYVANFERADAFFRGADRCGLRIFSKEANVWACPAAWHCSSDLFEYSLVAPESVEKP